MELDDLLHFARSEKCSDVHLTAGTNVAVRRYGQLRVLDRKPTIKETEDMIYSLLNEDDIARVKAGEDVDVAAADPSGSRIRINVYHQRNNLAASIRLLEQHIPTFAELGMPKPKLLEDLATRRSGLVLVTGPTGSGKSTTLASMINFINKTQAKHVMTIEDPIEYVYQFDKAMIHQRQVGKDVPDFATALRSSLREDPDVIMVGEMRDYETISAAITAAETGHLVLSTLHTKSAAQTVDRIISACPIEGQPSMLLQLSALLVGVITQELVPTIDGESRVPATEIMINNTAVGNLIKDNKTNQINSVLQSNMNIGMHTLNHSLQQLVRMGTISREEALKHSNTPAELERLIM
ncbi:MAG: type IV pilus twitching motility protein PilT [Lachnospira sp.]